MPIAYVLMSVETGTDEAIMKKLKEMNVEEAYEIYGAYDIIAKLKADSIEALKKFVSKKIRTISDVRTTLTLVVVD